MSTSTFTSYYSLCSCCAPYHYANVDDEPSDKCGGRRNNCKPKATDSIGFRNYFKMFLCRFPEMDKCRALRKARCIYGNLSENTKQKYRDLGCDFRCCVRRKVQRVNRTSCPKPKRKACNARRPQQCRPKRKPRAKPCAPACLTETVSVSPLVKALLDYLKAKSERPE